MRVCVSHSRAGACTCWTVEGAVCVHVRATFMHMRMSMMKIPICTLDLSATPRVVIARPQLYEHGLCNTNI